MNLCALGRLPKQATSPGTPEPMGAARPGLAIAIRHGTQKPSCEAVVSSGLRAGWEIPVELGKGQARTRSKSALSEEGWGVGPTRTARLGSDFPTWEDLEHSLKKSMAGTRRTLKCW